jgi:polysaccharide export outer membrane protein
MSGDEAYTELAEEPKEEYVIKSGDQIAVNVFTNNGYKMIDAGLAGSIEGVSLGNTGNLYDVSQAGYVRLPQIDTIKVVGLTELEASVLLEKAYEEHIQDPFVQISVTNRRAFVYRGNDEAAVVPLVYENMTMVEVIAAAGGVPATGKAYKIKLIRGAPDSPEISKINMRNPEDLENARIIVEANDIIYIEPSFEFTFIEQLAPTLSVLSSGLAIYLILTQ